ncbi:PASTA domain-containing protein [Halopseudomonas maritima]|uniref:PASTA domain-containing protein n=1 Tax=Halopseudomonas maritima TaxID=2918528 RepID=UPI001EECBC06|nr:PASTA domain-containing protein [Halopseudomonas maritima]UJJ29959.1 PASTA domain-containing protein [Halopseudomonas maritima]
MPTIKELVSDVMAAPIGELIAAVGQGVADAQQALDRGSLAQILEIYSHADSDELKLLQQIGYQPTFYALPETTGEIQVALSLSGQQTPAATPAPKRLTTASLASHLRTSLPTARVYAAPVNADLTNRYGFQANAAAKIQFKIVPIPAPGQASEIRVAPNLTGMQLAAAEQLCAQLDISLEVVDKQGNPVSDPAPTSKIGAQQPEAGDIVLAGALIQVEL